MDDRPNEQTVAPTSQALTISTHQGDATAVDQQTDSDSCTTTCRVSFKYVVSVGIFCIVIVIVAIIAAVQTATGSRSVTKLVGSLARSRVLLAKQSFEAALNRSHYAVTSITNASVRFPMPTYAERGTRSVYFSLLVRSGGEVGNLNAVTRTLMCRFSDATVLRSSIGNDLAALEIYTPVGTGVFRSSADRGKRDNISAIPANEVELLEYNVTTALRIVPPATAAFGIPFTTWINGRFWNWSRTGALQGPSAITVDATYARTPVADTFADGLVYAMPSMVFDPVGSTVSRCFCSAFMMIHDFGMRLQRNLVGGPEARAFMVDHHGHVVSDSHGITYERRSYTAGTPVPRDCYVSRDRMACLYDVDTHAPYHLLRLARGQSSLTNHERNAGLQCFDLTDGDTLFLACTATLQLAYPIMSFKLYYFVPVTYFEQPSRDARDAAIGVSVAIALVVSAFGFVALHMIASRVEDLAQRMSEDPWQSEPRTRKPRAKKAAAAEQQQRQEEGAIASGGGDDGAVVRDEQNEQHDEEQEDEEEGSCWQSALSWLKEAVPFHEVVHLEQHFAFFGRMIAMIRPYMQGRAAGVAAHEHALLLHNPDDSHPSASATDELSDRDSAGALRLAGQHVDSVPPSDISRQRGASIDDCEIPAGGDGMLPQGNPTSSSSGEQQDHQQQTTEQQPQQPQQVQTARRHVRFSLQLTIADDGGASSSAALVQPSDATTTSSSGGGDGAQLAGAGAAAAADASSAPAAELTSKSKRASRHRQVKRVQRRVSPHLPMFCFAAIEFGSAEDFFSALDIRYTSLSYSRPELVSHVSLEDLPIPTRAASSRRGDRSWSSSIRDRASRHDVGDGGMPDRRSRRQHAQREQQQQQQQQQRRGEAAASLPASEIEQIIVFTAATARIVQNLVLTSGATMIEYFGDSVLCSFRLLPTAPRSRSVIRFFKRLLETAEYGSPFACASETAASGIVDHAVTDTHDEGLHAWNQSVSLIESTVAVRSTVGVYVDTCRALMMSGDDDHIARPVTFVGPAVSFATHIARDVSGRVGNGAGARGEGARHGARSSSRFQHFNFMAAGGVSSSGLGGRMEDDADAAMSSTTMIAADDAPLATYYDADASLSPRDTAPFVGDGQFGVGGRGGGITKSGVAGTNNNGRGPPTDQPLTEQDLAHRELQKQAREFVCDIGNIPCIAMPRHVAFIVHPELQTHRLGRTWLPFQDHKIACDLVFVASESSFEECYE